MELSRRIKLYVFGVVIGGVAAWAIYGKKLTNTAWMPEARVKLRLSSTLVKATPSAQQQLDALSLDLLSVRLALDSSQVDFKASTRTDDSLFYVVHTTLDGRSYTYGCAALRDYVVDSTATLTRIAVR
ncbi:MAG TPA: hypothetical protein VGE21_11575 [Flavobacteriales bacterium]